MHMVTAVDARNAAPPETCVISLFQRGYRRLITAASLLQSPLLLAMRLYWGWQFFESGKAKLMNPEK